MKLLRRIGIGVGALAALGVIALGGVYGFSAQRMSRTYALDGAGVRVPTDAAAVERGRHIAVAIVKCGDCHRPDFRGGSFIDGGVAFGHVYTPNLTRGQGGIGAGYSDADWVRAIRHGVAKGGRPIRIMPSEEYAHLSDEDLGALIAYLKSVPPIDNEVPRSRIGPVARALFLAGEFPMLAAEIIPHGEARPARVEPVVGIEYGRYLATVGGCNGCHGPGLSGGRIPGAPPAIPAATNISPAPDGIAAWTEADFFRALRTGTRPDESKIHPFMPWLAAGRMTDDEIRAVWLYLRSMPPRPTGTR